jgi:hypothetical protein
MIQSQNEFIGGIMEIARREARHEVVGAADIRMAVVVGIDGGKAVIRFSEDAGPSQKRFPALNTYIPAVGDRVMVIQNVIIGGWTV